MPHRPDSRNTMVVVWSTNNFPGLHWLSKALFHPAQIMWKMSLSKVSLLFFSHKDVRWRELEFPNMLIRVSVNSAPSSTVLESSFRLLEISCAWATQVCLWVKTQYVLTLKEYRIMKLRNSIKQWMSAKFALRKACLLMLSLISWLTPVVQKWKFLIVMKCQLSWQHDTTELFC